MFKYKATFSSPILGRKSFIYPSMVVAVRCCNDFARIFGYSCSIEQIKVSGEEYH